MIWGMICLAYTIGNGIGSWGANKTVGWAWDITNFVWWIGIGHAGTLDFCDPFIIPSAMENVYQPFCRSDDDLRRNLCRIISIVSHGSSMVGLLDAYHCQTSSVRFG